MIIWITGISGSGKTTIARELISMFKKFFPEMVNIDGDEIRELYGNDLGYEEKDRIIQIKRIQRLCLLLEKQNLLVLVSTLYSSDELLAWNRKNFKEYYEIYLDAPIELVEKRDVKGLYKRAKNGLESNVVGVDICWNKPQNPNLTINFNSNISLEKTIEKIIDVIPIFKSKMENNS
tara:strand:+ start:13 stop:543 length:531 start_codon:yes stop_codon:yes gene_type:complete